MFLRRKLTYAGLTLGLLTAFGAVAQAQQPSTQTPGTATEARRPRGRGFRREPGPGHGFGPRVLRDLNLTDDQKQQVRSIIQQSFTGNKGFRDELRQLRQKRQQGTFTADDQARARTLHQQMMASMKETETKIASVLTADQKAKLEQFTKDRHGKREGPGGPRRGFPGGRGQGNPPAQKPANP